MENRRTGLKRDGLLLSRSDLCLHNSSRRLVLSEPATQLQTQLPVLVGWVEQDPRVTGGPVDLMQAA
jgi:hypothetical protein